jgi:hypothetical protein
MIPVDTSIWIDHLRAGDAWLSGLLNTARKLSCEAQHSHPKNPTRLLHLSIRAAAHVGTRAVPTQGDHRIGQHMLCFAAQATACVVVLTYVPDTRAISSFL